MRCQFHLMIDRPSIFAKVLLSEMQKGRCTSSLPYFPFVQSVLQHVLLH